MGLRRELLVTIGVLVALNLLLSFGAIGLLGRMGPAIERILEENVYSIVAVEDILAEFAKADGLALPDAARPRIAHALARAKSNVTENDERPLLSAIERDLPAAIDGDAAARSRVIASALALIRVNRNAMTTVDEGAKRLGAAGAWAAVFVGLVSFLLALLVVVRLRNRLLSPLVELYNVLEDTRQGGRLRRCGMHDAPLEVQQVAQSVNRLLDERLSDQRPARNGRRRLEAQALSELLRRLPAGAAVVDRDGEIARANDAMLERLSGPEGPGLRRALATPNEAGEALEFEPIDDVGWLVRLRPTRAPAPAAASSSPSSET